MSKPMFIETPSWHILINLALVKWVEVDREGKQARLIFDRNEVLTVTMQEWDRMCGKFAHLMLQD